MVFASSKTLPQLDGIVVLNKPSGPSSKQCLTTIKRLGQGKIGHAGTLDPMASGVLIALLGQGTKLSGYLLEGGLKIYSGTIRLGQETDTWDAEGKILAEKDWSQVTHADLEREVKAWIGVQNQTVPAYSAAKHEGKPLYKLARAGKEVPEKTKTIEVFQAELLSVELPLLRFRVKCSSGTYIRSLAHSLGMRLGCGATLTELIREYSHPFSLNDAVRPETIEENPESLSSYLHPLQDALPDWPHIALSPEQATKVRNGIQTPCPAQELQRVEKNNGLALLEEKGQPLALVRLLQTPSGPQLVVARGLWN